MNRETSISRSGVCIWLTGRSGGGKSTLVAALTPRLDTIGRRYSILDVVPILRKHWCERTSEGKLLRKAYVASEIVRHGGIAICVTVSARAAIREEARRMIGTGHFLEVLVDAPPEVAAARKARRPAKAPPTKRARRLVRRSLNRFRPRPGSGYQAPASPDLVVDAVTGTPDEGAEALFALLVERGFLAPEVDRTPGAS